MGRPGQPNDPRYAPAEQDPLSYCINDEQWNLFSFIRRCTPAARDPDGSAGMSIDQVWRRFTTGRPDVRIAYVEGGPNWHDPLARTELAGRMYLNTGELPLPERRDASRCSSYDCNRDGVVNVSDYVDDPRVGRLNGDITPQDLIAAFGNCRIVGGAGGGPGGRASSSRSVTSASRSGCRRSWRSTASAASSAFAACASRRRSRRTTRRSPAARAAGTSTTTTTATRTTSRAGASSTSRTTPRRRMRRTPAARR